jgi:hypothetical protein
MTPLAAEVGVTGGHPEAYVGVRHSRREGVSARLAPRSEDSTAARIWRAAGEVV